MVKQVRQEEAGVVVKPCVMCLTMRPHAVVLSWTEIAWFTHARKASLTCSECGLEREVEGDATTEWILNSGVDLNTNPPRLLLPERT